MLKFTLKFTREIYFNTVLDTAIYNHLTGVCIKLLAPEFYI